MKDPTLAPSVVGHETPAFSGKTSLLNIQRHPQGVSKVSSGQLDLYTCKLTLKLIQIMNIALISLEKA